MYALGGRIPRFIRRPEAQGLGRRPKSTTEKRLNRRLFWADSKNSRRRPKPPPARMRRPLNPHAPPLCLGARRVVNAQTGFPVRGRPYCCRQLDARGAEMIHGGFILFAGTT